MSVIVTMETFVYEGEQSSLSTRWAEWLKRFENYLVAAGITNDERKKALLLHLAGRKVHQIFEKLDSTPIPADPATNRPAETDFSAAKRALSEHFNPKINVTYNRHVFKSTKLASDESLDQFFTRLSELAQGCNFHNEDDEIKPQIILTCKSGKLRTDALMNPAWDLKTILEKGTTFELTKMQSKQIEEGCSSGAFKKLSQKKKPDHKGTIINSNKK